MEGYIHTYPKSTMGSFSLHPLPDGLPYACQAIAKHSAVVALILNVTIKIIDSNEIRDQVSGSFVVSIVKAQPYLFPFALGY